MMWLDEMVRQVVAGEQERIAQACERAQALGCGVMVRRSPRDFGLLISVEPSTFVPPGTIYDFNIDVEG